jgi:hypothetical protein
MCLSVCAQSFALKDRDVAVAVDAKGCLTSLKNVRTGHEYASGKPLWRLYFDRKDGEKEIPVLGAEKRSGGQPGGRADRASLRLADVARRGAEDAAHADRADRGRAGAVRI